jgi:hypothetical protein
VGILFDVKEFLGYLVFIGVVHFINFTLGASGMDLGPGVYHDIGVHAFYFEQ